MPKRIKVAGVAGLPVDATAISARVTVANPTAGSYVIVYNCSSVAPTAPTMTFAANQTIGRAGIFPLSTAGDLCVVSPAQTQLVIDVDGYFDPTVAGTFVPTKAPERAPQKETPDVTKIVAGYQGQPPVADGEKFDADPGSAP